MGYQRGSEELYRGSPTGSYNPDTLALMQNQQRRMLDQQDKQGQMYSEGVEGAGRELGQMIGAAPGAYMKGSDWRKKSDMADTMQAEENINLGAKQRSDAYSQKAGADGRTNEQRLYDAGLGTEEARALAAKTAADDATRHSSFGKTLGKNGQPMENSAWSAEYQQPGLANEATRAGIDLTRKQIGVAGTADNDRKIEKAATLYASGNDALAQQIPLSSQDHAIAKAKAIQIQKGAESTQNLLGQNSITGPQNVEGLREAQDQAVKLKQLVAAKNEYETAGNFSANEGKARKKMDAMLADLGEDSTSNPINPMSFDVMGPKGLTPRTRSEQAQAAIDRIKTDLQAKIDALEKSSVNFPDAQRTVAQLKQMLSQMDQDAKLSRLRSVLKKPSQQSPGGMGGGGAVPANYQPIFVPSTVPRAK